MAWVIAWDDDRYWMSNRVGILGILGNLTNEIGWFVSHSVLEHTHGTCRRHKPFLLAYS